MSDAAAAAAVPPAVQTYCVTQEHKDDDEFCDHEECKRAWSSFYSQPPVSSNVVLCFRCAEFGHVAAQCRTFKVRLCKYFEAGWCWHENSGVACPFAHGEHELRTPWEKRCVRVTPGAYSGAVDVEGCRATGHTFRECPRQQLAVEPAAVTPTTAVTPTAAAAPLEPLAPKVEE